MTDAPATHLNPPLPVSKQFSRVRRVMSTENPPRQRRRSSSLDGALAALDRGSSTSALTETLLLGTSPRRHRPHREEAGFDRHRCGPEAGKSAVVDVAATDGARRSRRSHNYCSIDGDIERLRPRTMTSTIGGDSNNTSSRLTGRTSSSQFTRHRREGNSNLSPHQEVVSDQGESTKQRRRRLEDENSLTSSRSPRASEKRAGSDSRERKQQQQQQQQGSRRESDKHSRVLSTSLRHHSVDFEKGNRLIHRHSDQNISSRESPGSGVRRSHRDHEEATARARLLDNRGCGSDEGRLSRVRHPIRERSRSRSSASSSPLSERRRRHCHDDDPLSLSSSSMKTPAVSAAVKVVGNGYDSITSGRRRHDDDDVMSAIKALTNELPDDSAGRIENRHNGQEHQTRYDRINASRKNRDSITVEREKLEIRRGDVLVDRLTRDRHHDRGYGEAYRNRRFGEKDRGYVVEERGRTSHRRHGHESPLSFRSAVTRNSSNSSIRHYGSSRSPDGIMGEGFENKHGDACRRTRAVSSTRNESHRHSRSEDREGSSNQRMASKSRQSSREHLSMLGPSKGAISSDIEGGLGFHRHRRVDRSSTPPSRSRSRSPDRVDVAEGSPVRATATTRERASSANKGDDERYCSASGKYASSPCSSRSSRGGTGRSSGARGSPDSRRRDRLDDHNNDVHCSIIRSSRSSRSKSSHHHRHRKGEETDSSVIGMTRTRTSRERQKNASDGKERVRISDSRCSTGGLDYDSRSRSIAMRSSSSHGNSGIRRQEEEEEEDRWAGREEEDRRRSRHYHVIEDRQERERLASSHRHSTRAHSSDSPERRSRHQDRSSKDEYSYHSGDWRQVRRTPSLVKTDREILPSMSQGAAPDVAGGRDGEGRHRRQHHESNYRREKDRGDHRLRHASASPLGLDTGVGYRSMG